MTPTIKYSLPPLIGTFYSIVIIMRSLFLLSTKVATHITTAAYCTPSTVINYYTMATSSLTTTRRRSPRLESLQQLRQSKTSETRARNQSNKNDNNNNNNDNLNIEKDQNNKPSKSKNSTIRKQGQKSNKRKIEDEISSSNNDPLSNNDIQNNQHEAINCLPRTREKQILQRGSTSNNSNHTSIQIIGVDEAGRGPLAGPVVASAIIIPTNIDGITDSKKISKEEQRIMLYNEIISSPNVRYAIAVINAQRIDEINILQATLEGMRQAVTSLIHFPPYIHEEGVDGGGGIRAEKASVDLKGSYVICGWNDEKGLRTESCGNLGNNDSDNVHYHVLIDGNRVPKDLPSTCDAEAIVKGDSKEYSIAAASILSKVTRDLLMNDYDSLYPEYEFKQHKGYPTKLHMAKVKELGATPIHRRTFAPLKSMTFDDDGKIISGDNKK